MTHVRAFVLTLIAAASAAVAAAASDVSLVMVDQRGCAYCDAWNDQIGPAYPNTAEGRFAPLMRANIHKGPPDGVTYARRVNFTPTFILVRDGLELARIEGYPGEDFFWPIYSKLLQDNTDFTPVSE